MGDPRVFFAAERTLLAWIRTGLTLIALGFVVARFGLFLRVIAASLADARSLQQSHWPSNAMGIVFVLLGTAVIAVAATNHWRYVRTLPPEDVPEISLPWLPYGLSLGLVASGIALAAYLAA